MPTRAWIVSYVISSLAIAFGLIAIGFSILEIAKVVREFQDAVIEAITRVAIEHSHHQHGEKHEVSHQ